MPKTALETLNFQLEISIQAIGRRAKCTGMALLLSLMGMSIKENGKWIRCMGKAVSRLKSRTPILGSIGWAKRRAEERK